MNPSAFSLTYLDWKNHFDQNGFSPSTLDYWTDGLYKKKDFWDHHISQDTQKKLNAHFCLELPEVVAMQKSEDGTTKLQIRFMDQAEVETVLIPFHKKHTICISTQVGCGMKCTFCYTGTQGLKRNLVAGEIVGQYLRAWEWLKTQNPLAAMPNLVFMGQGEPLHNFHQVKKSIEVLTDRKLIGIGHRQITLSTVGYLPTLSKLEHFPPVNMALSLHSPFDKERSQLIPANKIWPLSEVLSALEKIPLLKRQFITYEYLLIKDFNMSDKHAQELGKLFSGKKAIINLIPFNPFPGSKWERPLESEISQFKELLVGHNLRVMIRKTKGDDILAACGQLKIKEMTRKYDTIG